MSAAGMQGYDFRLQLSRLRLQGQKLHHRRRDVSSEDPRHPAGYLDRLRARASPNLYQNVIRTNDFVKYLEGTLSDQGVDEVLPIVTSYSSDAESNADATSP